MIFNTFDDIYNIYDQKTIIHKKSCKHFSIYGQTLRDKKN